MAPARSGLSYRLRKRLAIALLVLGLPLYIAVVWGIMGALDRPPMWLEFAIYVALGFLWALPFKFLFKGIGQADPDVTKAEGDDPSA